MIRNRVYMLKMKFFALIPSICNCRVMIYLRVCGGWGVQHLLTWWCSSWLINKKLYTGKLYYHFDSHNQSYRNTYLKHTSNTLYINMENRVGFPYLKVVQNSPVMPSLLEGFCFAISCLFLSRTLAGGSLIIPVQVIS